MEFTQSDEDKILELSEVVKRLEEIVINPKSLAQAMEGRTDASIAIYNMVTKARGEIDLEERCRIMREKHCDIVDALARSGNKSAFIWRAVERNCPNNKYQGILRLEGCLPAWEASTGSLMGGGTKSEEAVSAMFRGLATVVNYRDELALLKKQKEELESKKMQAEAENTVNIFIAKQLIALKKAKEAEALKEAAKIATPEAASLIIMSKVVDETLNTPTYTATIATDVDSSLACAKDEKVPCGKCGTENSTYALTGMHTLSELALAKYMTIFGSFNSSEMLWKCNKPFKDGTPSPVLIHQLFNNTPPLDYMIGSGKKPIGLTEFRTYDRRCNFKYNEVVHAVPLPPLNVNIRRLTAAQATHSPGSVSGYDLLQLADYSSKDAFPTVNSFSAICKSIGLMGVMNGYYGLPQDTLDKFCRDIHDYANDHETLRRGTTKHAYNAVKRLAAAQAMEYAIETTNPCACVPSDGYARNGTGDKDFIRITFNHHCYKCDNGSMSPKQPHACLDSGHRLVLNDLYYETWDVSRHYLRVYSFAKPCATTFRSALQYIKGKKIGEKFLSYLCFEDGQHIYLCVANYDLPIYPGVADAVIYTTGMLHDKVPAHRRSRTTVQSNAYSRIKAIPEEDFDDMFTQRQKYYTSRNIIGCSVRQDRDPTTLCLYCNLPGYCYCTSFKPDVTLGARGRKKILDEGVKIYSDKSLQQQFERGLYNSNV